MSINSNYLDSLIQKVKKAQQIYSQFSQSKVDKIFKAVAVAANSNRIYLARCATDETGMGLLEDKVIKNHFAAESVYDKYKDEKTCDLIYEDTTYGMRTYANPIGLIAGIIPVTNPTSTIIFKILITLKTRNGIILLPSKGSKKCSIETARILLEAAVEAGAPEDIIGWIEDSNTETLNYFINSYDINLVIATGGLDLEESAYLSGNPAFGIGAGNTPVVIDETANIKTCVNSIMLSKTFDNGLIPTSEQSIIVLKNKYELILEEFSEHGAYILTEEQKQKLGNILIIDGKVNDNIIGQSVKKIAELAGIEIPDDKNLILAKCEKIGSVEPFSIEKLFPILSIYSAENFEQAVYKSNDILEIGGFGHTAVLYTNQNDTKKLDYFSNRIKARHILINTPVAQNAIEDICSFKLTHSLPLDCSYSGKSFITENITIKHLINTKTLALRRENMLLFKLPSKIFFKAGSLPIALNEIKGKKRVLIVTDKLIEDYGYSENLYSLLEYNNVQIRTIYETDHTPSLSRLKNLCSQEVEFYQPDVIIALGGGAPISVAKILWFMYEHNDTNILGLTLKFMNIGKKISRIEAIQKKSTLIAIPTSSGTGAEVTPFAFFLDDFTGIVHHIVEYELTPDIAIIDLDMVLVIDNKVTAYSGFDAISHAIESYVSVFSTEYTNGIALESARQLFKYLLRSYHSGNSDAIAQEKVHYAATMAGISSANAFLGLCHAMSEVLGTTFNLPHGLANAIILPYVIQFNSSNVSRRQATFSQYKFPIAKKKYATLANHIGLKFNSYDNGIWELIGLICSLRKQLDLPSSIKEAGVDEQEFYSKLDSMSERAFDDQFIVSNPRYPLIEEIKSLYIAAYDGNLIYPQ